MPEDLKTANIFLFKTGTRPDLRRVCPKDIHFEDIKHNLSRIPRFTGNTCRRYTVAEHSILVMQLLEEAKADLPIIYQGLCHDFPEYLTGDISAPVKACVPEIREFEHSLWLPICEKFNIPEELDAQVKHYDWVALFIEAVSLCTSANPSEWENWDLYGGEAMEWIEKYGALETREAPPVSMIEMILTGAFSTLWDELKRSK